MARSALKDPLTKFRWSMSIPGFSKLAFTSCQMPSYTITTKSYAEGGQHWAPKSIPDSFEYAPIVLSRGATNDTSFNKWATSIIDLYTNNQTLGDNPNPITNPLAAISNFVEDSPAFQSVPSGMGGDLLSSGKLQYRKDIRIDHINRLGQVEVAYYIYGAYPIAYKPGSDFDAMGDDTLSIESLTLAYDSFEVKYSRLVGFLGNIAGRTLIQF